MKWLGKNYLWKDGDIRKYDKFLLWPKRFDGIWYWLETVIIREKFSRYSDGDEWWEIIQIKQYEE